MPVRRELIAGTAIALVAGVALLILLATGTLPGRDGSSEPAVRAQATPTRPPPTLPPPSATPQPPPPTATVAPPPAAVVDTSPPPDTGSAPPPAAPAEQETSPPAPREWLDAGFGARVLALVNEHRANASLGALGTLDALQGAAQGYAQTLTGLHTLSHDAGGDLQARVRAAGYGGNSYLGEVLWMGGGDVSPAMAVQAWLNSQAHHDIILDGVYTISGVGCYFWESAAQREVRCVLIVAG